VRIAALILHYRCNDLTDRCVASLRLREMPCDVYVIDNGSPEPYATGDGVEVIRLPENAYVTGGFNAGMGALFKKGLPYDAVWQLNNDVTFDWDVLSKLAGRMEREPSMGVISPAIYGNHHKHMTPRKDGALCLVSWVDWVAPLVRMKAWQEVGPFDTELRGYGMDLDWCGRARQRAWGCFVDHGARVFHESGATRKRLGGNGIDRNELMEAVLTRKWGGEWRRWLRRSDQIVLEAK